MPDALSPLIMKKLRDLCHRISSSHRLGPEAERILYTGMEDKLHSYLFSVEKLTEEDAFVLVREHFGDTEEVKAMLEDVHMEKMHGNLARCLGAILAATLGSEVLHYSLSSIYFTPLPRVLIGIGVIALYWFVLYRWQKAYSLRKKTWFLTIKPMYFLVLLFSLSFFLAIAYQSFSAAIQHSNMGTISGGHTVLRPILYRLFLLFMVPFNEFFWPFVWIWWFGRISRRFFMPFFGFIFWGLYISLLEPFLWHFFRAPFWLYTNGAIHNVKLGFIALFAYLVYAGLMGILKKRNQPVIE